MHELALSRAIVDAALRHADGRPITTVHVRLGALRQAVPESLAFYFDVAAADAGCAGARLELEPVPALLRCPACGREWDPEPPPLAAHPPAPPPAVVVVAGMRGEVRPLRGDPAGVPRFGCPDCGAGGRAVAGEELEVAWIEVEDPGLPEPPDHRDRQPSPERSA